MPSFQKEERRRIQIMVRAIDAMLSNRTKNPVSRPCAGTMPSGESLAADGAN
jgi:hypothetical protein